MNETRDIHKASKLDEFFFFFFFLLIIKSGSFASQYSGNTRGSSNAWTLEDINFLILSSTK